MYDIVIIGGGLVGLATGYQFLKKHPGTSLLIVEKEKEVCMHQSGHNSGVIHSGIYYQPGSQKAQNCIEGYHQIIDFAAEHHIPYEICGKIIVASDSTEVPKLNEIYQRGTANGLSGLKLLSKEEFQEIEPHCAGVQAIYVPQTGIIDYPAIAIKLKALIIEHGGEVHLNEKVEHIFEESNRVRIRTTKSEYTSKKLVSCAGLYSDAVSRMTQKENDLQIIPFRGEYYEIKKEKSFLINNLIYPVPDPKFPFLGVHFTRMIQGNIEAGPNAVLAFKKEGYKFSDLEIKELAETLRWPGFWIIAKKYGKIGMGEIYRSLSKAAFTKALQKLVPEINSEDLVPGGAGVRAQACNRNGVLIDDFDIQNSRHIIHVRNAPSPAATSCLSIGKNIVDRLIQS